MNILTPDKSQFADGIGSTFGQGLRGINHYDITQTELERNGLTEKILNETPPVGVNLQLILEMPELETVVNSWNGVRPDVTILGMAIATGASDFVKFLGTASNRETNSLRIVDIDSAILDAIKNEPATSRNTQLLHKDARETGIQSCSQDLVLQDHIGNCCPPDIFDGIIAETARILRNGSHAFINITTNDLLPISEGRVELSFSELIQTIDLNVVTALQNQIFTLEQLEETFPDQSGLRSLLAGKIVEIAPGKHIVFNEDEIGNGEWFSSFAHLEMILRKNGLEIIGQRERQGHDSHIPPLECKRFNLITRKLT